MNQFVPLHPLQLYSMKTHNTKKFLVLQDCYIPTISRRIDTCLQSLEEFMNEDTLFHYEWHSNLHVQNFPSTYFYLEGFFET